MDKTEYYQFLMMGILELYVMMDSMHLVLLLLVKNFTELLMLFHILKDIHVITQLSG